VRGAAGRLDLLPPRAGIAFASIRLNIGRWHAPGASGAGLTNGDLPMFAIQKLVDGARHTRAPVANRARKARRGFRPEVAALEQRIDLSTVAATPAGVTTAVHAAIHRRHRTRVHFPGGSVVSNPGQTTVTFPGGMVNSTPGSSVVNFPGGFVNTSAGRTVISFPGGSIVIG
jgi:hypothetical protein